MKVANATNLNRKSGGAKPSDCLNCQVVNSWNTNLHFVISGFQEWSAEPKIPSPGMTTRRGSLQGKRLLNGGIFQFGLGQLLLNLARD
jgi:hypothetical protein